MIPMNFMKSKAGFTLVELIVVIAILGILAGIAVPAYSGYIKKANQAADTQFLSAVYTAAASACATTGEVTEIQVYASNGDVSKVSAKAGTADTFSDLTGTTDFDLYIGTAIGEGAELVTDGTYAKGAKWTGGKWVAFDSTAQGA